MDTTHLEQTARQIVAPGKGILAADESNSTMGKRLKSIGVENSEENRLAYREAIFSAAGAEKNVSGVILYDETIRQKIGGVPVPQYLASRGIIPGIKVDKGTKPLPNSPNELITEGLDGLAERCKEYYALGARFARQVARRHHDRRRHPVGILHPGERARARALRGHLPGVGPRPHRRARGPHGRGP
jgi:fructose-bisphosphate aldolase, class I